MESQNCITYDNAPIIELIAELRWNVPGVLDNPPIVQGNSNDFENWFFGLLSALKEYDYSVIERLQPRDIPEFAYTPLFRVKKGNNEPYPLIQFGHGILTINAGQPNYQAWINFRPEVEKILFALVDSMPPSSEELNISNTSLRYIDRFNSPLRENKDNFSFITEDLGLGFSMPESLMSRAESHSKITPSIAMNLPLASDSDGTLNIQVTAGHLTNNIPNSNQQISHADMDTFLDLSYSRKNIKMPFDVNAILECFDTSRDELHFWFKEITKNISSRMSPRPC